MEATVVEIRCALRIPLLFLISPSSAFLGGKLTPLHGSPESPGVIYKSSESKSIVVA